MSNSSFKFEEYERYYGGTSQVKKIINHCEVCGAKLIFTHLSDYKNFLVQESAHCPECGQGSQNTVHIIN